MLLKPTVVVVNKNDSTESVATISSGLSAKKASAKTKSNVRGISAKELTECLNKVCTVAFRVMSTGDLDWAYALNSQQNFRRRENFEAILVKDKMDDINPNAFIHKKVTVTGRVQKYKGRMQIVVRNRSQVR